MAHVWGLQRPLPAGLGQVTQWFGERACDYGRFGLAGHNGLDYGVPAGSPVLAAHGGLCRPGFDEAGWGLYVVVAAGAWQTLYAHLSRLLVAADQAVVAGQALGATGSTGFSSGPHLHFGWRVNGVRNPAYADWLDPLLGRKLHGDA